MAGNITLNTLAQLVLTEIVQVFNTAGVSLPTRRYVSWQDNVPTDCVAEGSRVALERGSVPIEEVREGDQAWSWVEGHLQLQPVTRTMKKSVRELIEVRTGNRTLRVTPDHRLLVLSREDIPRKGLSGPRIKWSTTWREAKDIQRGDELVVLRELPEEGGPWWLADGTLVDNEVAWFLGALIGDGYLSPGSIHLCLYGEQRETAIQIVKDVWGLTGHRSENQGVSFHSVRLTATLASMGLDRKSVERRVPDLVWRLARKEKLAFLEGYATADGHSTQWGQSLALANRLLAEDIRALYQSVGVRVSNLTTEERKVPIWIKGKEVQDAKPLTRFHAYLNRRKTRTVLLDYQGARRAFPDPAFCPDGVRSVELVAPRQTYDLTIEGSHNFLVDGAVCHNCEQVVVNVDRLFTGLPAFETTSAEQPTCGDPRSIDLSLYIIRCVPKLGDDGVTIPSHTALNASSLELLTDVATLFFGLREAYASGDFLSTCQAASWGPVTPVGSEGGYGGLRMGMSIQR